MDKIELYSVSGLSWLRAAMDRDGASGATIGAFC